MLEGSSIYSDPEKCSALEMDDHSDCGLWIEMAPGSDGSWESPMDLPKHFLDLHFTLTLSEMQHDS